MLVLSFRSTLESALTDPDVRHGAGNIRDIEELLTEETFRRMEEVHEGVFAYLAFHPVGDPAVTRYLLDGTLADDAGPKVLVLFVGEREASWPKPLASADFEGAVEVEQGAHPSRYLLDILSRSRSLPLPGLVFFEHFRASEPIHLSLEGLGDAAAVRASIREGCLLAQDAWRRTRHPGGEGFADALSLAFLKQELPYTRVGSTSLSEWFVRGYRKVNEYRKDILSVVKLVG